MEIASKQDLESIKNEIIAEIKKVCNTGESPSKKWLRSSEVRKLLNISPGTLQSLRINGTLNFSKLGGTIFYDYENVIKVLDDNKK